MYKEHDHDGTHLHLEARAGHGDKIFLGGKKPKDDIFSDKAMDFFA